MIIIDITVNDNKVADPDLELSKVEGWGGGGG